LISRQKSGGTAGAIVARIVLKRFERNAMASTSLHESPDELTPKTVDEHRAIVSLMEELEAIDWYNQRAGASKDSQLQAILKHNRDEEIEHACMTLEWLRRSMPKFDAALRLYLFAEGDITAIEENTKAEGETKAERKQTSARLTVGYMKENHHE
jgi:hypothetical protein